MSQFSIAVNNRSAASPRVKKLFTLAEANRALPLVKRIAQDIQSTQAQRLRLHAELSAGISRMNSVEHDRLENEFARLSERFDALIEEMEKIGVELKDPTRGLLDFPCIHEGREVLLCWKGDEPAIMHWHEVDAGFAGRKPVVMLHE